VTITGPGTNPIAENGGEATFTASRDVPNGMTPSALQVSISLGGSASGSDCETLPSSVSIPQGQSSMSFTIKSKADNLVEGAEQLTLSLSSGNYEIGSPSSTSVTITDDPPIVTVAAVDPIAAEPDADYGSYNTGLFRFSRSGGDISESISISYTVGGTASNGSDYELLSGNITIAAGSTFTDLPLLPIQDDLPDGSEIAQLTIAGGNYLIGAQATAEIEILAESEYKLVVDKVTVPMPVGGGTVTNKVRVLRHGDVVNDKEVKVKGILPAGVSITFGEPNAQGWIEMTIVSNGSVTLGAKTINLCLSDDESVGAKFTLFVHNS
jgi:ribosomal protein L30E